MTNYHFDRAARQRKSFALYFTIVLHLAFLFFLLGGGTVILKQIWKDSPDAKVEIMQVERP